MLIDFFYTLRSAKLPVSVKEYLTLLEALRPTSSDRTPTTAFDARRLLLPVAHRAGQGREALRQVRPRLRRLLQGRRDAGRLHQGMPLDWLRKTLERELTAEEKAKIEKMGWDELMETLKKRFEEQKERHEGGSKWIGTGGTSPVRRTAATTRRASASARTRAATRARSRSGTSAPTRTTTTARSSARATSRSRCAGCASFAREGARGRARPGRHHPLDRRQRRLPRHQDACPSATTTSRCCC